jgi:predicted permease
VILVLLAILGSTAAGVAAEHRLGDRAERVTAGVVRALLWGILPPVVFVIVSDLELTRGVGLGLGLAYVVLGLVGLAAFAVARLVLHLRDDQAGAVVCTSILANTGYLGIPLCAALLGRDALGPAIAWDSVVSSVMLYGPAFAVGAALGTRSGTSVGERIRAFLLRNPVLPALVLGVLTPDLPRVVVDAAELVALGLLPVGFFLLGLNLRPPVPLSRPVGAVLGLRLVLAPLLLAGLATAVGGVPDAYLLQAAMPSGINSIIVAQTFGLDVRLCAAAVAWTTIAAVVAAVGLSPLI